MRFDQNTLILIFILLAGLVFFNGSTSIEEIVLTLPGLIISLTLHEFAHAYVAVKLGDPTPENQGRLTISPLAHMDPVGTICLIFAGFGWGKPVQINPTNFKNPEKDSAKVSAAGPIMNLILAFIFSIIYSILVIVGIKTGNYASADVSTPFGVLYLIIVNTIVLNLGLAIFNLLPFPPLDGSKIFRAILKGKAKEFLYKMESYSMLIIMVLFVTEIPSMIINPIVSFILTNILDPLVNWIINLAL